MSQVFQEGEKYFPYTKSLAESVSIDRGWVIDAIFEQSNNLFVPRQMHRGSALSRLKGMKNG
jgi:hypothetical protein